MPISLIPNGSGNDLASCLKVKSVEQALDWLIKADTVKMDVNKILLDVEHESEIPASEPSDAKFRYSIINAAVGYIAKCVHKAAAHKPYLGSNCYVSAAIANFFTTDVEDLGLLLE